MVQHAMLLESVWGEFSGSTHVALMAGAGVLVAVCAGWLALWLRRRVMVWRMQRRFKRGAEGERRAAVLLRAHGYIVLKEQLSRETGLWVDGVWRAVTVRADALARKRGKRYIVEVKTGKTAPDPTSSATRRQLFEYSHVYRADGLLLADMERDRLVEIRFPARTSASARRWGWSILALCSGALGVVLGFLLAGGGG